MSSNGTFSSGRRDHGQFAQPPPNGPTLSPFLPPSLRPSSFNPSPSTTSSSYYILPNPTPVSAFIPILARGRARGRNPFEVLSAPVFDEFIDDVTTRIRNALLGPPPPPPLPKPVAEESIPKEKEIADVFGQVVAVGQRVNGRNSDGVTAHMESEDQDREASTSSSPPPAAKSPLKVPLFSPASPSGSSDHDHDEIDAECEIDEEADEFELGEKDDFEGEAEGEEDEFEEEDELIESGSEGEYEKKLDKFGWSQKEPAEPTPKPTTTEVIELDSSSDEEEDEEENEDDLPPAPSQRSRVLPPKPVEEPGSESEEDESDADADLNIDEADLSVVHDLFRLHKEGVTQRLSEETHAKNHLKALVEYGSDSEQSGDELEEEEANGELLVEEEQLLEVDESMEVDFEEKGGDDEESEEGEWFGQAPALDQESGESGEEEEVEDEDERPRRRRRATAPSQSSSPTPHAASLSPTTIPDRGEPEWELEEDSDGEPRIPWAAKGKGRAPTPSSPSTASQADLSELSSSSSNSSDSDEELPMSLDPDELYKFSSIKLEGLAMELKGQLGRARRMQDDSMEEHLMEQLEAVENIMDEKRMDEEQEEGYGESGEEEEDEEEDEDEEENRQLKQLGETILRMKEEGKGAFEMFPPLPDQDDYDGPQFSYEQELVGEGATTDGGEETGETLDDDNEDDNDGEGSAGDKENEEGESSPYFDYDGPQRVNTVKEEEKGEPETVESTSSFPISKPQPPPSSPVPPPPSDDLILLDEDEDEDEDEDVEVDSDIQGLAAGPGPSIFGAPAEDEIILEPVVVVGESDSEEDGEGGDDSSEPVSYAGTSSDGTTEDVEMNDVEPTRQSSPPRVKNVIEPGAWDPSTPIRLVGFGHSIPEASESSSIVVDEAPVETDGEERMTAEEIAHQELEDALDIFAASPAYDSTSPEFPASAGTASSTTPNLDFSAFYSPSSPLNSRGVDLRDILSADQLQNILSVQVSGDVQPAFVSFTPVFTNTDDASPIPTTTDSASPVFITNDTASPIPTSFPDSTEQPVDPVAISMTQDPTADGISDRSLALLAATEEVLAGYPDLQEGSPLLQMHPPLLHSASQPLAVEIASELAAISTLEEVASNVTSIEGPSVVSIAEVSLPDTVTVVDDTSLPSSFLAVEEAPTIPSVAESSGKSPLTDEPQLLEEAREATFGHEVKQKQPETSDIVVDVEPTPLLDILAPQGVLASDVVVEDEEMETPPKSPRANRSPSPFNATEELTEEVREATFGEHAVLSIEPNEPVTTDSISYPPLSSLPAFEPEVPVPLPSSDVPSAFEVVVASPSQVVINSPSEQNADDVIVELAEHETSISTFPPATLDHPESALELETSSHLPSAPPNDAQVVTPSVPTELEPSFQVEASSTLEEEEIDSDIDGVDISSPKYLEVEIDADITAPVEVEFLSFGTSITDDIQQFLQQTTSVDFVPLPPSAIDADEIEDPSVAVPKPTEETETLPADVTPSVPIATEVSQDVQRIDSTEFVEDVTFKEATPENTPKPEDLEDMREEGERDETIPQDLSRTDAFMDIDVDDEPVALNLPSELVSVVEVGTNVEEEVPVAPLPEVPAETSVIAAVEPETARLQDEVTSTSHVPPSVAEVIAPEDDSPSLVNSPAPRRSTRLSAPGDSAPSPPPTSSLDVDVSEKPLGKGRGKRPRPSDLSIEVDSQASTSDRGVSEAPTDDTTPPKKRGRGRPRKSVAPTLESLSDPPPASPRPARQTKRHHHGPRVAQPRPPSSHGSTASSGIGPLGYARSETPTPTSPEGSVASTYASTTASQTASGHLPVTRSHCTFTRIVLTPHSAPATAPYIFLVPQCALATQTAQEALIAIDGQDLGPPGEVEEAEGLYVGGDDDENEDLIKDDDVRLAIRQIVGSELWSEGVCELLRREGEERGDVKVGDEAENVARRLRSSPAKRPREGDLELDERDRKK